MNRRDLINIDRLFDDLSRFALNEQEEYMWQTRIGPTALAMQWLLISLQSATSDWHIDAGALDTFVHVAVGSKYWVTSEGPWVKVSEDGLDCEDDDFMDAVLLEEGDDLCVMFFLAFNTNLIDRHCLHITLKIHAWRHTTPRYYRG